MTKLNQVIAIEKGVKSRTYSEITDLHKAVQKPELFNGFTKTYRKINEADETFPPESKRVQFIAADVLRRTATLSTDIMHVTAQKDWTNQKAKATVMVDGKPFIGDVPVSYLLFLEKQLSDLRDVVDKMPLLDPNDNWTFDTDSQLSKAEQTSTHRTKKVVKPIVMYDATKEHPAQTQLLQEDVTVGFWDTQKLSGAMTKPRKEALLARIETMTRAVKAAREEANGHEVVEVPKVGDTIFGYLLA
jgi:hypothetical protein